MALKPRKEKGGIEIENAQSLDLKEDASNGSNKISLKAPASLSGDTTYTLPEDGPVNAVLQTDASGTLSWTTGVGSGGINYINNYDAATNTTGWSTYDDGAVADPVDGTGGTSSNLTFTRNTSSPLRGTADFDLAKGAADAQGEGVSYDFDIDSADQAKVLRISFDYTTNANYADDDIRIQIYDRTNSQVIQTVGRDLKAISGKGKHIAEFQTAADSTAYRLCVHVASTNASAYDLNFDNVEVGPREIARGSVVTDWKAYTPTVVGCGTITNVGVEWRRVGNSVEVRGRFNSGTVNGSTISISLPSGLTSITESGLAEAGGQAFASGSGEILGTIVSHNGTTFGVSKNASGNTFVGATGTNLGSSQALSFNLKAKIQGWSANSEISTDFGGRILTSRAYRSADYSLSATGSTFDAILLNTLKEESTSIFDSSVNGFVIPESGWYNLSGCQWLQASGAVSSVALVALINTASTSSTSNFIRGQGGEITTAGPLVLTINQSVKLKKGDVIRFGLFTAGTIDVKGSETSTLGVTKIQSPQTLVGSETIACRAFLSSASTNTSSGSEVDVALDATSFDTHNAFNTSTNEFTAPIAGIYKVQGTVQFQNLVGSCVANIVKNGSVFSRGTKVDNSTGSSRSTVSDLIELSKGDTVNLGALQDDSASESYQIGSANTYLSIYKIG